VASMLTGHCITPAHSQTANYHNRLRARADRFMKRYQRLGEAVWMAGM